MDLEELREKIDELDKQLLEVISKRCFLVKEVAKLKNHNHIAFKQPEREKEMFVKRRELARSHGLNEDFVEKIFRQIIDESLRIEKKQ